MHTRYTLFPIYFRSMAAIFVFQHTQTSESIFTSFCVLLYLENMGIWPLELCCYHVCEPRYTLFLIHFRSIAAIYDFQHTQTSDSILSSLFVLSDPENVGVAVGISLLSCLRAEIYVIPIYFRSMATILNFAANSRQPLSL